MAPILNTIMVLFKTGLYKVGDLVRDGGKYPFDCDGVVVCTKRFFWELRPHGYSEQRAKYSIVVRFKNGTVDFYNPDGSRSSGMPVLYKLEEYEHV